MKDKVKNFFCFSTKNTLVMLGIIAATIGIGFLLRSFDSESDVNVSMLFVLSVFLISRLTAGYFYGIMASIISIACINYIFTYPYFAFNFTLSGYPMTFFISLVISITTSVMTTRIKLQDKLKSEAEAVKMRNSLLRSISHDIRTPLTSIMGATSAVLENYDTISPEKRNELLSESREEAEWLIRMVENILSITRMDGGAATINKTPQIADEIVEASVRKFHKRFPNSNLSVTIPDEPLLVAVDIMLIQQVLDNMLENAVVHAKSMTKIWLKVAKDQNSVAFSVEDNGMGIANDSILLMASPAMMYNPQRVNADGKRNMGIGLTLCDTIIKAHGGILTAENNEFGGAKFMFSLPIYEETQNDG